MKKILIAFFVIISIGAIIFFGMKSCDPRKKEIISEEEKYSAFINANTEFICEIEQNTKLKTDIEKAKSRLNEIYAKYKLPVEDDQAMLAILKEYENNEEAINIIKTNSAGCQNGGSPIFFALE